MAKVKVKAKAKPKTNSLSVLLFEAIPIRAQE